MKKTLGFIVFLVVVVAFIGLILVQRNGQQPSSTAPEATAKGPYQVALVVNGAINSSSWNSVGEAGVRLIERETGVHITYSENVDPAKSEAVFRQYAQSGYDFIVGYGDEFVTAINVVAAEFPHLNFAAIADYGNNNTNLGTLSFRAGEMGYLLGTVAAVKSQTHKLAYLGGQDFPVMETLATQYERGARAYNPAISVTVQWVGNWNDPDHATQMAKDLIAQGVDVIAVNAGAGDSAVFTAAQTAGIYALASGSDLHQQAPSTILTSAVLNVPQLLLEGVTLSQAGRWQGTEYSFGIADGAQDLAPFYGLLNSDQDATVKAARDAILNGTIDTSQGNSAGNPSSTAASTESAISPEATP